LAIANEELAVGKEQLAIANEELAVGKGQLALLIILNC
jgi:hypothetical protein